MSLDLAKRAIEHLPDAVLWLDRAGRVVHANAAARELQFAGRTIAGDLDADMGLEEFQKEFDQTTTKPRVWTRPLRGADGSVRPVELTFWRIAEGAPRIACVVRDIRMSRPERLQLYGILERCPAAVAISGPDGVIYANPAHQNLLGYGLAGLRAVRFRDLVHPGYLTLARNGLERAKGGHQNPPIEICMLHKDGSERMVQFTSSALGDGTIMAVIVDITDMHHLRRGMADHGRRATYGELASGVAAELGAPLRALERDLAMLPAALSRLATSAPDAIAVITDVQTRLDSALRNTRRLAGLADDLETYAQGGDHTNMPHDLNQILETALELAWPRLRKCDAQVFRDLKPAPRVMGNGNHLVQLFVNLLLNAADALNDTEGVRRVTLRLWTELNSVVVTIADTGRGVPPSLLPRLTEPFFTTRDGARGMGLSISDSVAETLGGSLYVAAAEGTGLVVTVRLPAWQERTLSEESLNDQVPRILVIDDDPLVLNSFERLLRGQGEVTSVGGGREAVELLRNDQDWDAVLCDLMMPEIGGDDLYEMVQEQWPELAERWAFITGGAFTGSAADFLRMTHAVILDKPVTTADLHRTVKDLCAKRRR